MKDRFSPIETQRRLEATLRGAFSGSPTPLKDVPKKNGDARVRKPKKQRQKPKTA